MNDPHVVSLKYRVQHAKHVHYDRARPLTHDGPEFSAHVEDKVVRIEMKCHYATEEAALAVVRPFIQAWELEDTLMRGPEEFRLAYDGAEIIDRNPAPGVVSAMGRATVRLHVEAEGIVGRGKYPAPPPEFASLTTAQWSALTDVMRDDAAVVVALRVHKPFDWGALYKVLETIRDDIGGEMPPEWVSDSKLRRLKHTAQHPASAGLTSRHGWLNKPAPVDPMPLEEARETVRSILLQWIAEKARRAAREPS